MIKKIKRYINSLNYKQSKNLIFCICSVLALLLIFYFILNWNNYSTRDFYELIGMASLTLLIIPLCVGLLLFYIFDVGSKRLKEEAKTEKKELENIFTKSNNTVELIVSDSTNHFPKDIILYYLKQKGTQFWLEYEKTEKSDEIKGKIYITDKDNPDKKIEFPEDIENPLYIKSHFKIKN